MSIWNVPKKLAYALFVAGDARLGEDARPALSAVLEALAKGPPPAVALREWIVEYGRMGTLSIESLRSQLPSQELGGIVATAGEDKRLERATNAMLVAAADGAAIDPRSPWGLLVLAATMASASGGVVYDSGTQRLVPKWILENPLDGFMLGSIKNHIAILSSTDAAGLQRTTTLGLNKYGLFELELAGMPANTGNIGTLLAGLTQAVVDARPTVAGPWDVPPEFNVTRLHVAHAFANELASKLGGHAGLSVREKIPGDVYWCVVSPDGQADEVVVRETLIALGIGNSGGDGAVGVGVGDAADSAQPAR